jgi:hypothetical protein
VTQQGMIPGSDYNICNFYHYGNRKFTEIIHTLRRPYRSKFKLSFLNSLRKCYIIHPSHPLDFIILTSSVEKFIMQFPSAYCHFLPLLCNCINPQPALAFLGAWQSKGSYIFKILYLLYLL